ncbi:MAG: prolyl oligopeptidase family serine peptidase [Bacteroidota bacterium]
MHPFKSFFVLSICLGSSFLAAGQEKKSLSHEVYDSWKSINHPIMSRDGNWVSYEINAEKKDGYLYLYDWENDTRDSVARGAKAAFSFDGQFLVYSIRPHKDSTRQAKLAKKKDSELPKDSLGVWVTASRKITKIPELTSVKVPTKGGHWLAYLTETKEPSDSTELDRKDKSSSEKKKKDASKTRTLVLWNPVEELKQEIEQVESYQISENGKWIGWMRTSGDSTDSVAVELFDTEQQSRQVLFEGAGRAKRLVFDQAETQASFILTQDTSKTKVYSLWYWRSGATAAEEVVHMGSTAMLEDWAVSEHGKTGFSENGERLYFGTAPMPLPESEDSVLENEQPKLDVWNWQDPRLQPQQSVELKKDEKKTYRAVWHVATQKMVQLANEQIPRVDSLMKGNANIAMGIDNQAYLKQRSWEWPAYRDVYAVNVESGEAQKVLEQVQYANRLSPGGNYVYWYDPIGQDWYTNTNDGNNKRNLTASLEVELFNIFHNTPMEAYSYPLVGWTEGDAHMLISDHYDLWKLDPSGKEKPQNLTKGFGRKNKIRFRYQRLNTESPFVEPESILLLGMQEVTKEMGVYTVNLTGKKKPELLMNSAHAYRSFVKAKEADKIMWRRETFSDYPELYVSDRSFKEIRQISHTNPQQKDYWWGNVKMVNWTSYDGSELAGRLYTPENLDPGKKYPMIVYFYERSSDGIHRYSMPSPSRSIVYPSIYASNGYVIFIPDIVYKTGQPGLDAYNAVMSGTDHVLQEYTFLDSTRMGLQGHSWGGYQIAHIVTQTNRYAAAMAGAPVSNMTSAYGGIRWSTGLSRMFQYEETQSRLGTTLWEDPERYLKNSPLFYVPQIETPVLMMHNDKDGAVPWYQGIEFFVALRRLAKPVWMLVYNGEGHNLRGWANRKDLSIRMMQYFDHFLKKRPMPVWMSKGIPTIDKGKKLGYELEEADN